jgi:hypothetical protein
MIAPFSMKMPGDALNGESAYSPLADLVLGSPVIYGRDDSSPRQEFSR